MLLEERSRSNCQFNIIQNHNYIHDFSSHANVYIVDDLTGGLELSHTMSMSSKDFTGSPGNVREMKWTPDGCAVRT